MHIFQLKIETKALNVNMRCLKQRAVQHTISLSAPERLDRAFFVNRQGNPLTRAGATYILCKYVQMAGLHIRKILRRFEN